MIPKFPKKKLRTNPNNNNDNNRTKLSTKPRYPKDTNHVFLNKKQQTNPNNTTTTIRTKLATTTIRMKLNLLVKSLLTMKTEKYL